MGVCSIFTWDLIRSNSRFGPRSNPNFYRIDVILNGPPGSHYISSPNQRTGERLAIDSLVRAHATSTRSIHDITESLASDLLAKFPAASEARLVFYPDIRRNFKIYNLFRAECYFLKLSNRRKCPTAEHNSIYKIITEWHLPIPLKADLEISFLLETHERSESAVHAQFSDLESPRLRYSLNRVHPTFGLHEKIAKYAEQLQVDRREGAAFLLGQCLFQLADKESPCERLRFVRVSMREVMPWSAESRTERAQKDEKRNRQFVNNNFAGSAVQLTRHQYEQSQRSLLSNENQKGRHRAFLALGSNLGNRVEMIESAVQEMSDRGINVLRTSALYETKPMYLENQESFINGACEVCITDLGFLGR